MSDIHVLDGNNANDWRVAFHIDVSATLNSVGVSFQDALKNSSLGGMTKLSDGNGTNGTILVAERIRIENGELIEVIQQIPMESGGTSDSERLATLRSYYATAVIRETQSLESVLRYFGQTAART